jgi:hypothetical protein
MLTEAEALIADMEAFVSALWPAPTGRKAKPSKRQTSRILAKARRRQRKTGVPCTHNGLFVYELALLPAPRVPDVE